MDRRQEKQTLDAVTIARQIKWVRNQLAELLVERHPSYLLHPSCSKKIELNLPTAVLSLTEDEAYRALRLLVNLRKLTYAIERGAEQFGPKTGDFKRLNAVRNKDNGLRVRGRQGKLMRLYTRGQVATFVDWLRRRYNADRRPL